MFYNRLSEQELTITILNRTYCSQGTVWGI